MDLDELMKYIDEDEGKKKKGKKKNQKKQQAPSKTFRFIENCNNEESKVQTAVIEIVGEDRTLEKEVEEFKEQIRKDSIKCGQYSKIKPKFSDNWLRELIMM